MRIAICDDEKKIRELLAEKVRKHCPDAAIRLFESGTTLLCAREQFDIVFLDIQMPGRDGIEIARELREKEKDLILIFVTAAKEYVFQAFDVSAFHYLVKPFSEEKFSEVLKKAIGQAELRKKEADSKETREPRSMVIRSGGMHTKVFIDDIVYAEVLNRKVTLHLTDGVIEYYGRMSELEKLAGADFYRVHRAYLINLKYVKSYDAEAVRTAAGSCLIAGAKYQGFVKAFLRYTVKEGER